MGDAQWVAFALGMIAGAVLLVVFVGLLQMAEDHWQGAGIREREAQAHQWRRAREAASRQSEEEQTNGQGEA